MVWGPMPYYATGNYDPGCCGGGTVYPACTTLIWDPGVGGIGGYRMPIRPRYGNGFIYALPYLFKGPTGLALTGSQTKSVRLYDRDGNVVGPAFTVTLNFTTGVGTFPPISGGDAALVDSKGRLDVTYLMKMANLNFPATSGEITLVLLDAKPTGGSFSSAGFCWVPS